MAPREPPSQAILDLCEKINATGRERHGEQWREVTPYQIEKRLQEGLLPQPARPGRGRSAGRKVLYGIQHVEAGVEVAELIHEHHSTGLAAIVLFIRRRHVTLDRVRLGYLEAIKRLDKDITTAASRGLKHHLAMPDAPKSGESGPQLCKTIDRIALAEPVFTDRLNRIGQGTALISHALGTRGNLEAIVGANLGMFYGHPEAAADIKRVFDALGSTKLFATLTTTDPPAFEGLPKIDAEQLVKLANTASDETLIEAREAYLELTNIYQAIPSHTDIQTELRKLIQLLPSIENEIGHALSVLGLLSFTQYVGCAPRHYVALTAYAVKAIGDAHLADKLGMI
ncbi:MAG: hypothetical protein ABSH36_12185 [Solirubrobacteraceae bacterium]